MEYLGRHAYTGAPRLISNQLAFTLSNSIIKSINTSFQYCVTNDYPSAFIDSRRLQENDPLANPDIHPLEREPCDLANF